MIHVLVASALPLAVFFAVWAWRGRRVTVRGLVLLALACAASGVWAVIPDTPRLWGDLGYYVALHHRSYCDVWWFHCAIDRRDDIDSSMLWPALFVIAALSVLAVAWLELRRREREAAGGVAPGGEER